MKETKEWDQYFMEMAYHVASRSKDPDTNVGAVIIGSGHEILTTGYNSLPRGLRDDVPERMERPAKYQWFEHAERNSIYNAARVGARLVGGIMYITGMPCIDCARAIQQVGITEVITHSTWDEYCLALGEEASYWIHSLNVTRELFEEGKVKFRAYDGPINTKITSLFRGVDILQAKEKE